MTAFRFLTNASIAGLLLLILSLVFKNSGIPIPPGSGLVAGLLIAAVVLIGGEYLIKKWALTDSSAKAARTAFYFAAIVIAGFGIFHTMSGGINVSNMGPSYLHQMMRMFGFPTPPWWLYLVIWFAAGSIAVMFMVGVYNHFRDGAPAVTKGTATLILTGAIILLLMWMVLGPTRTGQALTAVQNGARTEFDGLLAGGKIEVNWNLIALGFFGLATLLGLWTKDKIRTAAMILGAVIWLPLIAWLAIKELPDEFKQDVRNVTSSITPDFIQITQAQREAARLRKEAQVRHEERLRGIQAEEEARARVAAEVAAARALEESMMDAKAVPCVRLYTDQIDCVTVTFGVNTKYDREAKKDHCVVYDPVDAIKRTDKGGNQYLFEALYEPQSGLVAQFFDVPIGKWIIQGKEVRCGV